MPELQTELTFSCSQDMLSPRSGFLTIFHNHTFHHILQSHFTGHHNWQSWRCLLLKKGSWIAFYHDCDDGDAAAGGDYNAGVYRLTFSISLPEKTSRAWASRHPHARLMEQGPCDSKSKPTI